MLRMRPQTLAKWAMTNKNLPVIRLTKRAVRYRLSDVENFVKNAGGGTDSPDLEVEDASITDE